MTVATVKAVVTRFLTTDNPEVLAVKGAWGVGKTYAWNQLVRDSKDKIKLPSYCYVSLFGITSLAELKLAIFAKTQPAKQVGNKIDLQSINEDWFSIGLGGIKRLFAKLPRANDVPYLKHLSVGFDVLAPHLIHDIIICLDDFERLSDLIEPDALLGLISELKEEKNCKIALIFNEDELEKTPAPSEIGNSAALHGADLLRNGYTVDQVVHDYGDVCQAVTEMAVEQKLVVTVDEFRTLNRCLDNAIADAVTAYSSGHDAASADQADNLHKQESSTNEQRRLINVAIQTFEAIKTGKLGASGATGTVLVKTLSELRVLIN